MYTDGWLNMLFTYGCNFLGLTLTSKQAIARGLKDPSFRVIQNHFAISSNVGEVAAKVYSYVITKNYTFSSNNVI